MNTERPPSADRPVIGSPRHILLKPHQIINISSNHRHLHTNLIPGIIPLTKKHRILLDESRIITPRHKIRRIHDPPQISDIRLHPGNLILEQNPSHPLDRILPASSPHDQLTDHRIIKHRNLISLIHITVHPYPDTVRLSNLSDNPGRRQEIGQRILGTNSALNRMPPLDNILLPQSQRPSISNMNLLLYQIDPQDLLCNRMLDLQAQPRHNSRP